ncbi:MAG: four helix bundle protein [Acidobacteria bacterium]|nr:four helix bundle protein [Acidobacteriota bacterium]
MQARELRERTFEFACRIVRLCRRLSQTPNVQRQISAQLLRAGTSVGANLKEAKSAHTRKEFSCKLALVLREAREASYWLRLIQATGLVNEAQIRGLVREADELVAIFTVAARKSKENRPA